MVLLPFFFLIVLLCAAPAMAFFDGPIAQAAMAATTALAVALVGIRAAPGEATHLQRVLRLWAVVAGVPALWMILQALPLPGFLSSAAHPIWSSAVGALENSVAGSISIDPGMTIVVLGRYLTALGIILATTAATLDRGLARSTLFVLTAVTTLAAVLVLATDLRALAPTGATVTVLKASAALGVVISLAAAASGLERHHTQHYRAMPGGAHRTISIGLCVASCALCGFALHSTPALVMLAASCGAGLVVLITASRRLNAAAWAAEAIFVASAVAMVFVVSSGTQRGGDIALRFAVSESTETSERMLADTSAAGSGAGTFAAVLPVYGTVKDIADRAQPPTFAALTVIELGRAMWVLIVLTALMLVVTMLHRAMLRGRDWQYSAAAAGTVLLITIESFADATLTNSGVITISAVTIGIGLAQSLSRATQ